MFSLPAKAEVSDGNANEYLDDMSRGG